ncbi:hypothetical protein ACFQZQ_06290 [Lysobacter koreensis]|uniref:Uncharacterized protein n=1 Tax=Lysobacter koreensis TaxID=266122 RepID=A0ABW2YQV1_9GAMM
MRTDPAKQNATQKESLKRSQKDLENLRQPQAAAHRDHADRGKDETGQARVRSQDPNFGRGKH